MRNFFQYRNYMIIASIIFLNNLFSQPNFSIESQLSGISANASFVIDLDQDSDMDIIFSSYETNKLYWLEKNESDNLNQSAYIEHDLHQESQIENALDRISSIFSIDFDSDGDLDIIASGFQNDMVGLYLNDGTEEFDLIEIGNPNGPLFVTVVDLDNNGFSDIVCASLYDNTVQWYKTEPVDDNGQMSYSHEVISNNAVGPSSVAVKDIDNDGDLDVVSAGTYDSNNKVAIYFNDGDENFSELVINSDNGAGYADVSVADIFQGGNLEIVAASSDNKRVTLFYDSGDLSYSNSTVLADNYNVNYSQIIDMDSDNDLDVLFSGFDASLSQTVFGILKNDGNGSFNEEIIGSFDQGASIRGSKVADLDLDQDLDILYCSSVQNYEGVYCLENTSFNDTPLELNVPGSFSTIQEAINASSDGDIVIVAAGTYVENINFSGKNIIVQGENSETTIIDGNQNGSVVTFNSGETSSALLTGFTVQNGSNNSGAGIYCYNASSPSITHCIISGNVGIEGAGIKCDDASSPNITDCIILGNTALGNGGGICTPNSSPVITNCLITGNTANDGGGIFFYLSNATITNSTISNNVALADGGENGGGGIHCNSASPTITDCIISENTTNYGGGGIYCTYSSSPTITNCTITENTAAVHGGGIDCYNSSSPIITNSTISNNTASWGGGFWILSTPTIKNCTIVGNTATNGGGAIESYSSSSYPVITNCTITGNTAPDGGIRSLDAFATITNCILWNNSPVEIYVASGDNPNVTYSDIKDFDDIGIEEGNGNIDADPMWVDPPNGNFTLQPSSPCINAGDPSSPLDPDGSVSDMGAYPYQMIDPQYPNHSLSFDGNDYVSINSNNDILTSNNGVSINLYFKKQDFNGHQFFYDWGVYSGANVTDAFRMKIDNGGILETWVEGNDNYSSPGFSYNLNNHETNLLNTWVQVTVVYGMNTTKLYLNGSLVNEATNNMSENAEYRIFDQSGAWYWIGDQGDNQYGFNGSIDEFSIWSKEFSDSDVESMRNASFHYGEEHLVGYWTFNEGEGNLVHDQSGNGYDGTVNGSTWSDDGAPVMPASIASVEVGTVQGYPNSEISVPVHIDLMQESVSSIEISFSEFQDHMEFVDIELEGAMVGDAEWDVVLNSQEDLLLTLSYGANEISGEGVLFHLRFNIPEEIDTDFVPVMIEYVHLDELEGDIEILNGGVEVNAIVWGDVSQNGDVSGYDASLVLKYLVGTEELDENQLFVADVTQDATISALDASAIAQYVVQLIDVLPLDDPASVSGDGEFYVNDTELIPGDILEIPIELSNGENLLSFEFSAEYDESVFALEEIVWSDLIDHFSIEENLLPGSINIAGMGTSPDGEEGTFGSIRLYVNPDFSDQNTSVSMSYRINESVPVENINVIITNSTLGLDNSLTPKVFALHQNYPNPFNPTTQIKYDIAEDSFVSIAIYDVMGRNIRTLMNVSQTAGYHSIHWDAKNDMGEGVSAGMYIYTIQAGEFRATKKMVLLK